MKIYKYTSINSAIAILKSGGVALSNPADFNDPNDCSFIQDKKDKERIERLVTDYFVYKTISELVSLNRIALNKSSRAILTGLQKEMEAMKWILQKHPYFDRIPGFNSIARMMGVKSKEADALVSKAKKEFQDKIDEAVRNAKESALISCFSKRNNSILMWSHYANSHKGVCIEYDRPNSVDFRDVEYKKNRPYIKMYKAVSHAIALDILQKNETNDEITKHLKKTLDPFFIKSTDWSYEEEVRCLFSKTKLPDSIEYDGKRYILDIGYPSAIYIGCKAAGDELDHLYNLAENRGIPIYFMKESDDTFDVIVDSDYKFKPKSRKKQQEITLLRLVNDIDNCLNVKLYLAAFSSSLIVPAICSQVECSEIKDSKQRYIEWCNTYLPCASRGPDSDGIAFITGEILWNIKDKLFSEGNVDVYGHYEDFNLTKLILRIEERKALDLYYDVLGQGDVTTNVTKFCADMIYQANRCYKKHENEIRKLSQIPIEDYDAELERIHECSILSKRINEMINGKNNG